MHANALQIRQHQLPSLKVPNSLILHAPFRAEGCHAAADLGLPVLRHLGEEMVLDLAVEVAHCPADQGVLGLDVDCVVDCVADPVWMVVFLLFMYSTLIAIMCDLQRFDELV
jgi:hypothetical protein